MAAQKPLYKRFAQIGRVVLVQTGSDAGKLATIVDILDENRALIDGPAVITGVTRQVINFKDIALTDLLADGLVDGKRVKVARNARQKSLSSAWKALKIQEKWNATSWAKGIAAKAAKASLSDLGRFKAKVAKRTTASKIRARLGK